MEDHDGRYVEAEELKGAIVLKESFTLEPTDLLGFSTYLPT